MKVTRETIAAVKRAIWRDTGRRYHVEYGLYGLPGGAGRYTGNRLRCDENAEIYDTAHLGDYGDIEGEDSLAGMVLIDTYLYQRLGGELQFSGNTWVLFSEIGEVLAVENDHVRAFAAVSTRLAGEIVKRANRKLWTETAAGWRAVAKMPKGRGKKAIPLGIVADWVQDQDSQEAQTAAGILRQAIAAGWDV